MIDKNSYKNLCSEELTIPIFSQYWWLDAAAGSEYWNVALVKKGNKILASLPYTVEKKRGLIFLGQPPLTQTLGPWLRESKAKYAKRMSQEKKLMSALIHQLPAFGRYKQNWHHNQLNWLPFYWQGFSQTTRYTYKLNNLENENTLWENLQENIRREIRKATIRYKLVVKTDRSIDQFIDLNKMVFSRQGESSPHDERLIKRIDAACEKRNCRKIFIAEDEQGRCHAGVYIVWDNNSAYYLMGGGNPELRNSGATSLCMWEAIKFASTVTNSFDFEGSMIEPIERFFRAFGATQTPYYTISKTPSKILQLKEMLMVLIK